MNTKSIGSSLPAIRWARWALAICFAAVLAACVSPGGGGSRQLGSVEPPPAPAVREPPAQEPPSDPAEISQALDAIADVADSLLSTGIRIFDGFGVEYIPQTCSSGTCSGSGYAVRVSHIDFGDLDYEQLPALQGVAIFEGHGNIDLPSIWSQMRHQEYGGWLDHVVFFAREADFWRLGREGPPEQSVLQAFALGRASGSRPVAGSATWTGAMVGAKVDPDALYQDFARGNASVAVDFAEMTVDVAFTGIRDVRFGKPIDDIAWEGLPLSSSGSFEGETISGRFYGPMHEEAAGVFDLSDFFGAFGARRD